MKSLHSKKKQSPQKRMLIIGGIVAAIVVAIIAAWLTWGGLFPPKSDTTSGINYGPPTAQEKQETEQHKQEVAKEKTEQNQNQQPATPPPTNDGKKTVTPVITYARQNEQTYQVASYVPGVFEDGGTCTATFTKGSQRVTKTTTGISDASHTTCPTFTVQKSDFSEIGTWSVIVQYSSAAAAGTSTAVELSVQ